MASWRLPILEKLPPVMGFCSLTLYTEHHFAHPGEIDRCSFGTKIKNLHRAGHGPPTLTGSAARPRTRSRRDPAAGDEGQLVMSASWERPGRITLQESSVLDDDCCGARADCGVSG